MINGTSLSLTKDFDVSVLKIIKSWYRGVLSLLDMQHDSLQSGYQTLVKTEKSKIIEKYNRFVWSDYQTQILLSTCKWDKSEFSV